MVCATILLVVVVLVVVRFCVVVCSPGRRCLAVGVSVFWWVLVLFGWFLDSLVRNGSYVHSIGRRFVFEGWASYSDSCYCFARSSCFFVWFFVRSRCLISSCLISPFDRGFASGVRQDCSIRYGYSELTVLILEENGMTGDMVGWHNLLIAVLVWFSRSVVFIDRVSFVWFRVWLHVWFTLGLRLVHAWFTFGFVFVERGSLYIFESLWGWSSFLRIRGWCKKSGVKRVWINEKLMKKRSDEKIEKFCGASSGWCAGCCRDTLFFIGWLVAVVSFCF